MKKLIIGFVLTVFAFGLNAQAVNDYMELSRQALKIEKKAIITDAMLFSEEESEVFWPLYNEYAEKMYIINTSKLNLIKDFANSYETMPDEKAQELWTKAMSVDEELLKLEKTYFKKFLKILPATRVVRYFQIENKMDMLIGAELAEEIPLMQ